MTNPNLIDAPALLCRADANSFVARHHGHHKSVIGHKFFLAWCETAE